MATTLIDESTGQPPMSHRRRRWWLFATAVIVVVAGAVALVFALVPGDDAHSLFTYGGVNERWTSIAVGRTAVVGADVQPRESTSGHRTLDLRRVEPQVTINTAHATVQVVECTVADPHLGVGTEFMADLRRQCATLRPFASGPVDLGFPATELVYEITAQRPGHVRIEGSMVSYNDGDHSGEQHAGSGIDLVFNTKP